MSLGTRSDRVTFTRKQRIIVSLVLKGYGTDSNGEVIPLTQAQLHKKLPYECSYQALHCSIRHLIGQNMMTKDYLYRAGRRHACLFPTEKAKTLFAHVHATEEH